MKKLLMKIDEADDEDLQEEFEELARISKGRRTIESYYIGV
jgi:uncharacterized protein YpiB (UPF0302 family)